MTYLDHALKFVQANNTENGRYPNSRFFASLKAGIDLLSNQTRP
jgi:hypothetical protein